MSMNEQEKALDDAILIASDMYEQPTASQILDVLGNRITGRGSFHRRKDLTTGQPFVIVEFNGMSFDLYQDTDGDWHWEHHQLH